MCQKQKTLIKTKRIKVNFIRLKNSLNVQNLINKKIVRRKIIIKENLKKKTISGKLISMKKKKQTRPIGLSTIYRATL